MKRLDKYIVELRPELSRARARELISSGDVLVNGRKKAQGYMVREDDDVVFAVEPEPVRLQAEQVWKEGGPEELIEIAYEDEQIIVLEKPRLMHSVRLKQSDPTTVADCLAAYRDEQRLASPNRLEGGLVNRLDYFTSGLMLACKDRKTWEKLHQQFLSSKTEKVYHALVEGVIHRGTVIDEPIFLKKNSQIALVGLGEPAQTEVLDCKQLGSFSLVQLRAQHLVRHQIRAHLAFVGHPLVGDSLYGAHSELYEVKGFDETDMGFYLHSNELRFSHPATREKVEFFSGTGIEL